MKPYSQEKEGKLSMQKAIEIDAELWECCIFELLNYSNAGPIGNSTIQNRSMLMLMC